MSDKQANDNEEHTKDTEEAEDAKNDENDEENTEDNTEEEFSGSDDSLDAQLSGGDPLKCRMYENDYPKTGDLVIVEVKKIVDMGAYCSLLEYNNLEGMLLMSELQRRRIRSVKKVIKEGRQEIVQVLRVNRSKHFIDLSKKRVDADEIPKIEDKWNKSKAAHSIVRQVTVLSNSKFSMKQLYKLFGWQCAKDFGHLYDGFKFAMNDWNAFLAKYPAIPKDIQPFLLKNIEKRLKPQIVTVRAKVEITVLRRKEFAMNDWNAFLAKYPAIPKDIQPFLLKNIEKRLKPQIVTVRAKVEITCFTAEGVEAIKRALKAGLKFGEEHNSAAKTSKEQPELGSSDEDLNVKIKLVAPPLFTVSVSTYEPEKGIKLVNDMVDVIIESIEQSKGTLTVKQSAQVIAVEEA
eukprot:CAMPEP_0202728296 /NCGR_PEP_ID=MMETSP1385-20130828/185554_1 /ASSEMBLY_ACC=CAM_ASM_000861 /TAXON_ID=933848 /ORGANISM="Elphidium margaritaceum" /LENGTH=403 /DNA_ID=CAMNT_0049394543 /DNA_START=46 /DNA_END=1258 /DNA_ORIENTATION=-